MRLFKLIDHKPRREHRVELDCWLLLTIGRTSKDSIGGGPRDANEDQHHHPA